MNPSNSSPVQNQTKSLPHLHKKILPITDSGTYTDIHSTSKPILKSTPKYHFQNPNSQSSKHLELHFTNPNQNH